MIKSNFNILFSCEVMHTFFADNICKGVSVKPGKGTRALIERYGLVYKESTNGLSMYTNTTQPISSFLKYVTTATQYTCFDFELHIDDSAFNNYTELPVNWVGQFVYDTKNVSERTNSSMILRADLTDAQGPPNGFLYVHFDDLIAYLDKDVAPRFTIQFTARATKWQYYVIVKSKSEDAASLAVSSKEGITFDPVQNVTIETGDKALLFASSTLLELREVPMHRFDLVALQANRAADASPRQERMIYKGLPAPMKNKIGIVKEQDKIIVSSPIYVYV